jgi:hypothetical protein
MTEQEQIQLAEREAARLAALAAEPAIAAAAADREVGAEVLAGHLAPELAAAHSMMMQLAAAAAAVLDWPLGPPGLGPSDPDAPADPAIDTTPAALAAARLAGGAGRMMEQVRQGLPVLAMPHMVEDHWQALAWAGEVCSEAELMRRFEAAKAAALERRPAASVSPAARAVGEAARACAGQLAAEAGVGHLAVAIAKSGEFLCRVFAHELAAGHGLYMRLAGRFAPALARATRRREEPVAALRLAHASARFSARLRRGRATLAQVRATRAGEPGGSGGGTRQPARRSFWGGADGGYIPPGPEPVHAVPAATAGHGVPSTNPTDTGRHPPSPDLAATAGHGVDRRISRFRSAHRLTARPGAVHKAAHA